LEPDACGNTARLGRADEQAERLRLQVIKLLGQERAKGMARLRFQAGGRVLATLGRMLTAEAGLNKV
jgi:lipase chaperone LimK